MTVQFQENAVGVRVELALVDELDQPLDLTDVTKIEVSLSTPGAAVKEVLATIKNPSAPTDGLADFFTTEGLLVPSGDWEIDALCTFSSGDKLPTKVAYFVVKPNVKEP